MGDFAALLEGALRSLLSVSPWLLLVATALHLAKVAVEARAWHGIVEQAHDGPAVPFRTVLAAFVGSIGANAVLPARVGEAFRIGVLRRHMPGSSVATIVATIAVEALIEVVFAAAVVAAALLAGRSIGPIGSPIGAAARNPFALASLLTALTVGGVLAIVFRSGARTLAGKMARGFAVIRVPRALGRVCSWKAAAWTLRIASVVVFLMAFHMPATPWTALIVLAAQNVAAALPITPGNAGTQQAALSVAMAGTASATTVLGFGVGMQAATVLADLVAGAVAIAFVAGGGELRAALTTLRRRRTPVVET